jgi:2-oxoglutarate ferredoxin oxidoreductase subunit beta
MTSPTIRDTNRLLSIVPATESPLTRKDFSSDQEVRWCPGCGDYAILSTVQGFLPSLGIAKENLVVVSGIGCSSRFPYYVDSFGMHSIHGRAPAIATGLATSRRDLSVWVVTGDGDGLSIGASHLLHALRRNVNIKVLLFNNQIYGLTKGQYSPTSETGKITKSTPMGSLDEPFRPISLVLGAEATFVARSIDSDRKHLTSVLEAAAAHEGSAFIEIYQNCNIFNDGAYDSLTDSESRETTVLRMEPGQPLVFGPEGGRKGLRRSASGGLEVGPAEDALIHDPTLLDPTTAFALSRSTAPTPIGIFRNVLRPTYDELMSDQLDASVAKAGVGDLQTLLRGKDTWTVQ